MLKNNPLISSALALLLAFSFAPAVSAQSRAGAGAHSAAPRKQAPRRRTPPPAQPASPSNTVIQSRVVESSVETFAFRAESNTPLKAYLAPVGQIIIEFQADDPVYKVHPSDENFVTVDRLTDDSLLTDPVVLRPGSGFRVPEPEITVNSRGKRTVKQPKPLATSVTLQMYSGLLVPVIIYPVRSMEQNTNKLVLVYDREAVARARRAAGLAVNTAPDAQKPAPAATAAAAVAAPPPVVAAPVEAAALSAPARDVVQLPSVAAPAPLVASPSPTPRAVNVVPATFTSAPVDRPAHNAPPVASSTPAPGLPLPADLVARTRDELLTVVRGNAFPKFSKPEHGLSIAASRSRDVDSRRRIVVVAVRNTLEEPVRLVTGQPDIAVEILDGKKRLVDTRAVECVYLQTTVRDNLLKPGETGYYALVFETPTLGTHEYLRARVAQIFAADAPVTADLAITAR